MIRFSRTGETTIHGEDLLLVRGVLAGNPAETDRFIQRMSCVPRMLRALNYKLGGMLGEDDIADLTQDVLLILWRKMSQFEGRSTLETWVFRICRLEFMNALRRDRSRPAIAPAADPAQEASALDAKPSTQEALAASDALERVGSPAAEVIRLRHFEHLTFREIGARLRLPTNTTKSHYYRGLCRLRELLGWDEDGGKP